MNDIFLRHVAKLGAEGGQMLVVVLSIVEHDALTRGSQAVEGIHQGRFASARSSNDSDELAGRDGEGDVVDEYDIVVALFLEVQGVDADAVAFVVLGELSPRVGKFERSDTDLIARFEVVTMHELSIDVDVVGAVIVNDPIAVVGLY